MIYLHEFYKNKLREHVSETINVEYGLFSIKYTRLEEMPPFNSFGLYSWKYSHGPIEAHFYFEDTLLFTKCFTNSPSMVMYGDGKTKENTFFTFNEKLKLNVYNMMNEFIVTKIDNESCYYFTEFARVNDKFALLISQEPCTYDPLTYLVDLDLFFSNEHIEKSRVHVPLSDESGEIITLQPVVANDEGFIVMNRHSIQTSYTFKKENLVTYDDVFQLNVDFYENTNNFDMNDLENVFKLENTQLDITNDVISLEKITDDKKNAIFKSIATIYDQKQNQITHNLQVEKTCCILKPDIISKTSSASIIQTIISNRPINEFDYIIRSIMTNGFKIVKYKVFRFDCETIDQFYEEHVGKEFYPRLKEFMMSGECVVLVLESVDAIRKLRQLIGPTNVEKARSIAPHTLRAIYGNPMHSSANAVHGSDSANSAQREINFFKMSDDTN